MLSSRSGSGTSATLQPWLLRALGAFVSTQYTENTDAADNEEPDVKVMDDDDAVRGGRPPPPRAEGGGGGEVGFEATNEKK